MIRASILAVAALATLPAQQTPIEVRAIHEAVLNAIFSAGLPKTFVVFTEYRAMRAPDQPTWQKLSSGLPDFGAVPSGLKERVAAASSEPPDPTDLHTIDQFPSGALVLPASEVSPLTRGGSREIRDYPELRAKYGAGSVLSFSKPVMSADRLDALVYYLHGCGSACGTFGYVWLHRSSPTARWAAKRVVTGGS